MAKFINIAIVLVILIAGISVLASHSPTKTTCGQHFEWYHADCPKGDRWQCWGNNVERYRRCSRHKWPNHHTQFPNKKGRGTCYCCGSCPVLVHRY